MSSTLAMRPVDLIERLCNGHPLEPEQIQSAMIMMAKGEASPAQVGAICMGIRLMELKRKEKA